MSQPPDPDEAPSAAQDHARVMEMLTSAEIQARLEAARAQRERVLAAREAAQGTTRSDDERVARVLNDLVDMGGPSASAQHDAHVADVLGWSGMQRRLEDLRSQREQALAEGKATGEVTERPDEASIGSDDHLASPPRHAASDMLIGEAPRPVLRALREPLGPTRVRTSDAARPRRRPWPVSLVLGLSLGLALGAGLMRVVEGAAPLAQDASEVARGVGQTAEPAVPPLIESAAPPGLTLPPSLDGPRIVQTLADRPVLRSDRETLGQPQPADDVGSRVASAVVPTVIAGVASPSPPQPDVLELTQIVTTMALVAPGSPTPQTSSLTSTQDPDPLPFVGQEVSATSRSAEDAVETVAASVRSPQVDLRLPADLSQSTLREVQAALRVTRVDLASVGTARFSVAASEVRYFHEADALDAARVAAAVDAEARDFSAFEPAPRPGTLEVWLAENN